MISWEYASANLAKILAQEVYETHKFEKKINYGIDNVIYYSMVNLEMLIPPLLYWWNYCPSVDWDPSGLTCKSAVNPEETSDLM